MKRLHWSTLGFSAILLFCTFPFQAAQAQSPEVSSQVTFLYYDDPGKAAIFYEKILGFHKVFEVESTVIYRINDGGHVGLVDGEMGTLRTSDDKPVMLSIVTTDIEKWYERVKTRGPEYIKKPLKLGEGKSPIVDSFLLTDPEGYYVEFFQWKDGIGFEDLTVKARAK